VRFDDLLQFLVLPGQVVLQALDGVKHLPRGQDALGGCRLVDGGLAIGGQGCADFRCQVAGEVEGLDQAGGAELPGVDVALQRLDGGGRKAGEEFGAFGFVDGGAGFGFVLGGQQIRGSSFAMRFG
jgi:hypothetical protein